MIKFLDIFGKVFVASGALGIDGKGYYYDKFLNLIPGHNFKGSTFIAKTVTLDPRDGNLPLKKNIQPKDKWPKCIKIWPMSGHMLNAVGVSSPGLRRLLYSGTWDNIDDPFLISIIPVRKTYIERMREMEEVSKLLYEYKFRVPVGIQLNVSCPNTEVDIKKYINEIMTYLAILKDTKMMIDLKVNILTPVNKIAELIDKCYLNTELSIITCSNTIPFGTPCGVDWNKYKGLESMGGGGLSGPILLPYVIKWIEDFRKLDSKMPIKACGGIFSVDNVDEVMESGADAIEIGTVKLFRPYRIKGIIKRAYELLGN